MIFQRNMKMADLLENEQAAMAMDRIFPGLGAMAKSKPQAMSLSVEQLVRYARIPGGEDKLPELDETLRALNTPENAVSPKEAQLTRRFQAIARQDEERIRPQPGTHVQHAIYPGQPWLDTQGERIQAHGGAVYYENGVYYWYGENKKHTDGKNGVWTWGIKVYSSTDLCNWEDRGFLIPPVLDDPNAPLFPAKSVDRPHILKCPATGKYVCWIKISGPSSVFTIWQADRLLGPYTMVEAEYTPGGHAIGDFDLISDEATGKGYVYFDADHNSILCMELSPDYLHAVSEKAASYPDLFPPFTREAPALLERGGKKYMLTSGMTGYVPNRSDSAWAETWDGVFESIGDPHVEDGSHASFNSQISKVFRVQGTDQWIAMADRWLPRYPVDARLADLFERVIASSRDPEHYQATEAERREMYAGNVLESAETAIADYVWLPIHWEGDRPMIRWRDQWRPESPADLKQDR